MSIQSFANNASPDGMLAPPTTTNREQYDIAAADFATEYAKLKPILTTEIPAIEQGTGAVGRAADAGTGSFPSVGRERGREKWNARAPSRRAGILRRRAYFAIVSIVRTTG